MSEQGQIVFESANMGYIGSDVLSNVSLNLELGKIHCVFGRNGGGKTTFLKSLATILPLKSGEISINDQNLNVLKPKEKARLMATVLTDKLGIVNMSVEDYVSYGRYPYTNWLGLKRDEDLSEVGDAMESCGIYSLKERLLDELSDGEMQKVKIARALAQDVPILLLDEPASHLDLVNKAEIFNLLKNISIKNKKTVLFTSHDIQFALQLAENFIVINDKTAKLISAADFKDKRVFESLLKSEYLDFDPELNSLKFNYYSS